MHHATDEQFVLLKEKRCPLAAVKADGACRIDVIPMEPYKVYNIPQGIWFNTITQKDTKLVYVQDAPPPQKTVNTRDMTQEELNEVKEKAPPAPD